MITIDATDTMPFDAQTATLAKLCEARALCIQILEDHNMQRSWYLDTVGLRQVQMHKTEIETAGRERFGVRVWMI
ncbi:MAG: hypothetical protein JW384_01618 [Nitrosomonadaceae bacterium]|nr:hypothetical protein [Nitrosomonadaceae bacterium]